MITELKKLVIAQKTAALPVEAPAPELAELHSVMVRYDQVVSMVVIQAIQGLPFEFPGGPIYALRSELDSLFAGAPGGREVENYRKYRQRLDQMSDLTEQIRQNTPREEPG
jgi:hypothetical protein